MLGWKGSTDDTATQTIAMNSKWTKKTGERGRGEREKARKNWKPGHNRINKPISPWELRPSTHRMALVYLFQWCDASLPSGNNPIFMRTSKAIAPINLTELFSILSTFGLCARRLFIHNWFCVETATPSPSVSYNYNWEVRVRVCVCASVRTCFRAIFFENWQTDRLRWQPAVYFARFWYRF